MKTVDAITSILLEYMLLVSDSESFHIYTIERR